MREAQNRPAVSVIVPAYNTAAYIGETLQSVFDQTFQDYEVIVVNDGSPDTGELEKALEPYGKRIRYIEQENRGPGAARNTGIHLACAPLVALLDSDDLWERDYLTVQVGVLQDDPTIDVVYPNAVYFGDPSTAGREFMELCPSEGEVTFESLVRQTCNVMVSVTARREAIMRAGMFDVDRSLIGIEDFDLWLRLVKQGGRIAYHRRVLVRYRRRGESISSDPIAQTRRALPVLDKADQTLGLTSREKEVLRRERARFEALVHLFEGKSAFFRGEAKAAIEALDKANAFFRSRKIALALILLRLAPRLLLRAYRTRDRLLLRASSQS